MKVWFNVSKDWEFIDNSKQVKKQLRDVGETAMEAALLFIEGQAKSLAPVASGELRDKIDHRIINRDGNILGQVGSPLKHALS